MPARTDEGTFERIAAGFEQMAKQEIVIAPWLAMNDGEERLSDALRFQLKKHSMEFAASNKDAEVFWIDIDLTFEFLERAFYETLLSTAAYLSYMRLGTLIITEEMVSVSNSLLRDYLQNNGGSALLSVYARILTYLNNQLLLYYGQVSEDVFISGTWHRPWIDYSLEHELESAIHHGFMERVQNKEGTFIQLTEAGEKLYTDCRSDLDECGYIRQREQLMRAANFTNMDDYEPIMECFTPELHNKRKHLIGWSGITTGMKVLELGCGAGALTLDDGLYDAVSRIGSVTATDPSLGMLERAKLKLSHYNAPHVQFIQAAAEKLPFPDNSFDAVIGMLFLHFTDIPKAFEEIRRVTRPGGTFTTLVGLDFYKKEDFMKEWFKPILDVGLVADPDTALPDKDTVPSIAGGFFDDFVYESAEWSADFRHVENTVKFFVQAGMMAQLNELPWEARKTLFQDLIDRGYEIKKTFGAEGMRRSQPVQWFKGTVEK